MIVQLDTVLSDVRECMDENRRSPALLKHTDASTESLDAIIKSKVLDAVRLVESHAPLNLLENGHSFFRSSPTDSTGLYWHKDHSGWIVLPEDFMRLLVFEMSDWERPVTEALMPTDSAYELQRSSIPGVRGNYQRPVCAIVHRPEGMVLEFYSSKSDDATVTRAQYLPYPRIDIHGGIDVSSHCYRSIVYACAGLSLSTLGKSEESTNMMNISKSILE